MRNLLGLCGGWRVAVAGLALLLAPAACPAQVDDGDDAGWISGRVLSAATGLALPYANIMLYKLASPRDSVGVQLTGTFSLAPEGNYQLVASPGWYRLKVSHIAHQAAWSEVLTVAAGQTVPLDLHLSAVPALVLPKVEVRGTIIRNTQAALLAREKKAEVVADAISAEQVKRTADSNAAEALRRVAGLSLVEDKYVFVRGMGERYSSTQINGATVGSPEPNKRVVPLDLIPANMLDNAWIVKTYSPELPAEFAGGGVNIRTRDFPGRKTWSLAIASGMDVGTTGQPFLSYEGGNLDFLGIDDGQRDLPEFFQRVAANKKITGYSPVTGQGFKPDTLEQLGQCFNKVWVPTSRRAVPRYNIEGSYGNEFKVLGNPLGVIFGGVLKTSYDTRESLNNSYRPGATEGAYEPNTEYQVKASKVKHLSSVLGSTNYRLGDTATLHLRSMFNRIAEDETRVYEGQNHNTGAYMHNTRLRWTERTLWTSNLGTEHRIPRAWNSTLLWRVDYSRAGFHEPDRREYNYELREDSTGGYWELTARGPSRGFTRMFGDLTEEERAFEASWLVPLTRAADSRSTLRIGYAHTYKDRDLAYRRLAFRRPSGRPLDFTLPPESLMTNENIGANPSKLFVLTELTQPEDAYEATLEVTAFYLVADFPVLKRLRASGGVRMEDWRQEVTTRDRFATDPAQAVVGQALLEKEDWLPALNITYLLTSRTNLRAGFSRTISRPDLRELSTFTMPDYDSGFEYRGNPALKRAHIYNYDLRFETYPSADEKGSVSVFYKDLHNPIENSLIPAGGALRKVPVNASWGRLYGAELEGRMQLGRVAERLQSLAVIANLTLTQSRARVPLTSFSTGDRQRERPLQGQSPYLLNLMLFYTPKGKSFACAVTYNAFGKRMMELGLEKMPDSYEQPHQSVDFTLDYQLGRYHLKFTAANLLDPKIRYTLGRETAEEWRNGRSYQLKIAMTGQ